MVVRDTRQQKAYEYLYNAIVTNKLPPGVAIAEQEISNVLGISRTPVREALKQLEAEGLVRHIPLRGTFVEEITTQDLEEIFALRETLEVLALKTAINDITDEELYEIEILLRSLEYDSSNEKFYDSDRRLHDLIVKHGGNRRLAQILNNLNSQMERLRHIAAMKPHRLQQSKQEHLEIVAALKMRDLEEAERLLRQHLRNVKESTIEVCRKTSEVFR
ncbi:transcriptional regulator, GntR family [Thermacetogenium phaeum DSM 12270]|jgi:DNA-binding GntR family transcriptional regulator|uniref:Transcriptional regulator, GntR family n=1 Tax=Thermacetogenium phaeum (strain ATCC BAA-254 / DSM 26808 / PB) TaxID=1089553 RepID=K4LKH7_THEPS|nr:GntR family transcriptional regulator [Thermacetogenium phaeum]AFV12582.1 transcriptional regulator, GntR family [Thermacetogenium phaeum DSM 12270]